MLAPKGGARASPREHLDYSLLANDLQQKNARAGLEWRGFAHESARGGVSGR